MSARAGRDGAVSLGVSAADVWAKSAGANDLDAPRTATRTESIVRGMTCRSLNRHYPSGANSGGTAFLARFAMRGRDAPPLTSTALRYARIRSTMLA